MRGSVTDNALFEMSIRDKKIALKIIEEHIERTKKSQMPLL